MFKGRSKHTLDAKGRLSIPARFKQVLAEKGETSLVITNYGSEDDVCLCAYTTSEWAIKEKKALRLPENSAAARNYLRYFISGAVECPVKQGRINIPPDLREIAGLRKDVVVVGQLKKFEIWDRDKWELVFKRAQKEFKESSEALSEFGI